MLQKRSSGVAASSVGSMEVGQVLVFALAVDPELLEDGGAQYDCTWHTFLATAFVQDQV